MIKWMSSSPAGWVSIICLTSVSIAVSQGVELQTSSREVRRCGQNVTLTCKASPSTSTEKMNIKLFSWLSDKNKTFCHYEDGRLDLKNPRECLKSNDILTLTLVNVMPVHQGNYFCKLRSTAGQRTVTTVVTVQDCFGSPNSSINKSHAMCSYNGVYPSGTVHWFQGDVNLTDSASAQENKTQLGLFNVWSTIEHKGSLSEPYNCSLWIPSAGKYVGSQQLQRSSGSMVKLQWISFMVEVMLVKFMT